MLFPALFKRQLKISIVITSKDMFAVFNFGQKRTKFLKSQRKFYAQVFTGEITVADTLEALRIWLESVTEDYILERLEDSPAKYRPIFKVSPRVKLDFNVTEEDVLSIL